MEITTGSPRSSNWFVRHWHGGFSLGVAYWAIGSVFVTAVALIVDALAQQLPALGVSLRGVAAAALATTVFVHALWIWAIVGIWRSASRHVERGGRPGWAGAAKVMVVVGVLAVLVKFVSATGPQLQELFLIATGRDPLGQVDVRVSANGEAVVIHGALREGTAAAAERAFEEAPSATMLVLNSPGGRLLEGERLSRYVRERRLDTYVEGMCASACTYVFLAGKERAATPNARIGFHQPSLAGLDVAGQRQAVSRMAEVYRAARLPEPFIAKISATGPEDMWFPTRDELIAANVITRISLGGEAATLTMAVASKAELIAYTRNVPFWAALERRYPQEFEQGIEKAWAARERGADDAEMLNEMRSVMGAIFPRLLRTAEVDVLDRYLVLMIDQMTAARGVSDEACGMLLEGRLDITKTLPLEMVEREVKLVSDMLQAQGESRMPPEDSEAFRRAVSAATARLAEDHLAAIADPKAFADRAGLRCDAFISFYSAVGRLPEHDRKIVLRGLFQGE